MANIIVYHYPPLNMRDRPDKKKYFNENTLLSEHFGLRRRFERSVNREPALLQISFSHRISSSCQGDADADDVALRHQYKAAFNL